MKKWNFILLAFSLIAVASCFGCAALSHLITPAEIDQAAVGYAVAAEVAGPNDFAGYANLDKALRLEKAVADAYETKQLALAHLAEKNDLQFSQFADVTLQNRRRSETLENEMFGETGILTLGLGALGFGGLGGVIGLMRKRPSDITPEEFNEALESADVKLTEKQKQFAELVKGIGNFLKHDITADSTANVLKTELDKAESDETKKAVAVLKA